jgi:hypothetical protein
MENKDLTELSRILYEQLFTSFPDWEKYAEFSIGENDTEKQSLYVVIPSPANENHCILIEERGDCIEIAYSNGNPQMNAERQLMGTKDIFCVENAIEFIEEVIDEKIVVGQDRGFRIVGNKLLPLRFMSLEEAKDKRPVNVYSWQGNFNRTDS